MNSFLKFMVACAMIAFTFSCKKEHVTICKITLAQNTCIQRSGSGQLGKSFTNTYEYDVYGRLVRQDDMHYFYGDGYLKYQNDGGYTNLYNTMYLNLKGFATGTDKQSDTYIYDVGNHLIRENVSSDVYFIHVWQGGDDIQRIGYKSDGTLTGASTVYEYYDSLPFQVTQPTCVSYGAYSAHMLKSEITYTQPNHILNHYEYSYSFDQSGRVSSYRFYDMAGPASNPITGTWQTDLVYPCK